MGAQSDFDTEQAQIEIMRKEAHEKLRDAEKAWHAIFITGRWRQDKSALRLREHKKSGPNAVTTNTEPSGALKS